jgi:cysteine desulfurase
MNLKKQIFLDYNATAPLLKVAKDAMLETLDLPLNPSSIHYFGREGKKLLNQARSKILESLGTNSAALVFTSSGTESNNMALNAIDADNYFISAIEHISVSAPAKLKNTNIIKVDNQGLIILEDLESNLKKVASKKIFVSIIHANNETGVIQDVKAISQIVFKYNGILHIDASQSFGKIPLNFDDLGADLMTISSHKIGGAKGVASLIIKSGLEIKPFILGGGQEKFMRAGTENLPAIIAFAEAAKFIVSNLANYKNHSENLRNYFESELLKKYSEAIIFSKNATRLPNTSNFAILGRKSETELIRLDLKGFAVSSGSACSSGKVSISNVLTAMGYDEQTAKSAIRLSIGIETRKEEIEKFCEAI